MFSELKDGKRQQKCRVREEANKTSETQLTTTRPEPGCPDPCTGTWRDERREGAGGCGWALARGVPGIEGAGTPGTFWAPEKAW